MLERTRQRKETIFKMFAAGHTYAEIAKVIGTSRQYIQQLTRPPIQVLNVLRKRAGDKCERCRIPFRANDNGHVHHVDKAITGRFDDLKRVRLLCRSCHKLEDCGAPPEVRGRRKRLVGKVRCPECKSLMTYERFAKQDFICRSCGNEWKKP